MKRFYCTICKRVKRVRRFNSDVEDMAFNHDTGEFEMKKDVKSREGTCRYHHRLGTNRMVRSRMRGGA